jgi:hypothetical protein
MNNNKNNYKNIAFNKIIYHDDLFTFTQDDLFIIRNNADMLYILLDVSKYFNLYYSSFNVEKDTKPFTHLSTSTKKRKNNLILIGIIDPSYDISSRNLLSGKFELNELSIPYSKSMEFKLIPGDVEINSNSLPRSLFKSNSIKVSKRLKNFRMTDRRYHSSHHDMKLSKHVHNLQREISHMHLDGEINNKYVNIINNYISRRDVSRNVLIAYKKAKPFHTITTLPVIMKPLNEIMETLCNILYYKSNIKDEIYYAGHALLKDTTDLKSIYKFIRMQYVLISIGKYNEAAQLLIQKEQLLKHRNIKHNRNSSRNHKYNYKHTVTYRSATILNEDDFYNCPPPNIGNINKKTIDKYKKKFDLLYYQISKCNYRYNLNYNNPDYINVNYYILPHIRREVTNMLQHYSKLYELQSDNKKRTNTYLYLFYMNVLLFFNNHNNPSNILIVKQKFK